MHVHSFSLLSYCGQSVLHTATIVFIDRCNTSIRFKPILQPSRFPGDMPLHQGTWSPVKLALQVTDKNLPVQMVRNTLHKFVGYEGPMFKCTSAACQANFAVLRLCLLV